MSKEVLKQVFLIDMKNDDDYEWFVRETQAGGKVMVYSCEGFRIEERRRYLIADFTDCVKGDMILHWGSDNPFKPFGQYEEIFCSITGGIISLGQFFRIAHALTEQPPEITPYVVKPNEAILKYLSDNGYIMYRPRGIACRGKTRELIQIFPTKKVAFDMSLKGSENISQSDFLELIRN